MEQEVPEHSEKPPAAGRVATGVVAMIVLLVAGFWIVKSKPSPPTREVTYICSETLKPFEYELKPGDTVPVLSPYSGKQTGYPAELCFWTKDGKTKDTPTPVLLNEYMGKPGPTFCPDCGRLVVPHNPSPQAGSAPPPTESEYLANTATTQKSDK